MQLRLTHWTSDQVNHPTHEIATWYVWTIQMYCWWNVQHKSQNQGTNQGSNSQKRSPLTGMFKTCLNKAIFMKWEYSRGNLPVSSYTRPTLFTKKNKKHFIQIWKCRWTPYMWNFLYTGQIVWNQRLKKIKQAKWCK